MIAHDRRAEPQLGFPILDMLKGDQIAAAGLTDWRKLAQGLHARYLVDVTVVADQEGNTGVVCIDGSAAMTE